jgi:predicted small integral membrane protein
MLIHQQNVYVPPVKGRAVEPVNKFKKKTLCILYTYTGVFSSLVNFTTLSVSKVYSVEWKNYWLMTNWNGLERIPSWPMHGGAEETMKTFKTAGLRTEIRARHLPSISLERYESLSRITYSSHSLLWHWTCRGKYLNIYATVWNLPSEFRE